MNDYVRVRDKETGHHLSVRRTYFERRKDAFTELKQDATFADGTPLPVKHKTTVDTSAAKKSGRSPADTGQSADTSEEN